ncbi:MAG: hypothetical protein H8F28_10875, partial [Fibrella sp.]|nr:hypothetical protein [Armatimonadota bacterium]
MTPTQKTNTEIENHLISLADEDRRVRAELAATGELFVGYASRMEAVHRRNAGELEAIIAQCGWPGKSLVGVEGANAAWFILQHAVGNPTLQRRCLPLLQEAIANGEAEASHAAYLEDRIRFYERRPQRYGTQFDWDENGQMSPWQLEDSEQVDEFRRAVGLGPLAEKIQEARAGTADETPPDFDKRQTEMHAWLNSTGWHTAPTDDPLTHLRELCLAYPETSERLSHGEP